MGTATIGVRVGRDLWTRFSIEAQALGMSLGTYVRRRLEEQDRLAANLDVLRAAVERGAANAPPQASALPPLLEGVISRRTALRAGLVALLLALSAALALVGRAHTLILANEAVQVGGVELPSLESVSVSVDGHPAEELGRAVRAVAGPGHRISIEVLSGSGAGRKDGRRFSVPFGWDTVLLSIPGALSGAPPEAFATRYRAPPREEAPVERTVQQSDAEVVPLPPPAPPPARP